MAAGLLLLISGVGLVALEVVRTRRLGVPAPFSHGIFFFLFEQHERSFLLVQTAFAVLVLFLACRPGHAFPARFESLTGPWPRWLLPALGGVTLGIASLGAKVVFHDTPLTMDELAPEFEAKIIERGRLDARLPDEWTPFGKALTPVGVAYQPGSKTWRGMYLPGYAAIRALFMAVGLPSSANPFLAALTVLGIAATARRLFPGDPRVTALAVLLLLTSSQFLVNAMTFYSMPAHLCLNVWWLYLFLRADRFGLALAPWLGALALLLHNPVPHAVFVVPFLFGLVLSRRVGWCAYFAAIYSGAIALMSLWYRDSSQMSRVTDYVGIFSGPPAHGPLIQMMNLTLMFTWQSPLLALTFLLGCLGLRRLGSAERALFLGIVLSFALHSMFPSHQGHGWGYRYVHSVLGSVVLLGVSGARALIRSASGATLGVLAVASLSITVGFQFPLRALQAETFVAPYARAVRLVSSLPADIVIVDAAAGWYAQDLIRNDPFLRNGPKVLSLNLLTGAQLAELASGARGKVSFIGAQDFARLGIPAWLFTNRTSSSGHDR